MSAAPEQASPVRALAIVREQIDEGTAAKKCHGCGCFQETVVALAATTAARELTATFARARDVFVTKKYDCLGCAVCHPAIAANAFMEAFPQEGERMTLCPTEEPDVRAGWPPLPGDYEALRYGGRVAVCTLNSTELAQAIAAAAPEGLAIVGTMHTENLGIERLVENVIANPNIRCLVLCGDDTQQAVGHLPGQALECLIANGIDEGGRIVGARGKRPLLKNLSRGAIERFRAQVKLVSHIGETDQTKLVTVIRALADAAPDAMPGGESFGVALAEVEAKRPTRLVPDPAGYFVVYPDRRAQRIRLEHFTNAGVLTCVLTGTRPADLYVEAVSRGLVSRLDHCAYLGAELARAEIALATGAPYVQDRAAGEEVPTEPETTCGCSSPCGPRGGR